MQILEFGGVHVSEWIKTVVAVAALCIAANEFILKNRDVETAKMNNTRAFLLKGSEKEILDSASKLAEYTHSENLPGKWAVLKDLSPLHEYLVAWSACVESGLCDAKTSNRFLCTRIVGYEKNALAIFEKLGIKYTAEQRAHQYSGMLDACKL